MRRLLAPALLVLASACLDDGAATDSTDSIGSDDASDTADTSDDAGDSGGLNFVSLIDHDSWVATPAASDPLADHRPDLVECGVAGWYVEGEALEIDTNYCNYLALEQPSLAGVAVGATLRLEFYYFDLVAPEPAVAHVAVLGEDELLWELEVEIPGDAQVHSEEFEAPAELLEGELVRVHLHNHGQNTWVLQSLEVGVPQ